MMICVFWRCKTQKTLDGVSYIKNWKRPHTFYQSGLKEVVSNQNSTVILVLASSAMSVYSDFYPPKSP